MKNKIVVICGVLSVVFLPFLAYAAENFEEFLKGGKVYGDIRVRYEFVDQDGPSPVTEDAHSRTQRTRIGYQSGEYFGLSGVIEGEYVTSLGNDDYNDTVNHKTNYPTVADPENIEVNQAYGQLSGIADTTIRGGRQVIALDNHRFIGHVGWRQNNQTFDAVTVSNKTIPDTEIKYGYIYNVNRIFGEQSNGGDWGSKSNYFNISNTTLPVGKITAYGYFLDFGSDSALDSNQTLGVSLAGDVKLDENVKLKYYGEYAHQEDYGDNTTHYDADYYHIAPAVVWKGLTTTIGFEVLGSDHGTFGFRTPLATLHKFNGWADKFLTTPAAGLQDAYVEWAYKVKGLGGGLDFMNDLMVEVQYHNFSAEDGGKGYGNEWGIFLQRPINKYITTSVKYANYTADDFATDTQKIIFDVGIKF